MNEEIVGFIVLCGVMLLTPVFFMLAHKMISFLGDRFHWFKKYCVKKGQRLGREQVEGASSDLEVKLYGITLLSLIALIGLGWLLDSWLQTPVLSYILWIAVLGTFLYLIFKSIQLERYCLFCSECRDDVEQYIEEKCQKNQYYQETITDIYFEDGLYMIFRKQPKEIKAAMEEHVKVYTRECNDSRKWLLSNKVIWLASVPWAVLGIGVYFLAAKVWGLPEDWPLTLECVVLFVPLFIWWFKKNEFIRQSVDKLRKEENLPKEKYSIKVQYDKADSGKLVFRVIERSYAEQERMKHNKPGE